MRLLRVVVVLALLAVAGLSAYAYFGDMAPERREVRVPVSLAGDPLPQAPSPAPPDAAAAVPDQAPEGGSAEPQAAGADDLD